LPLLRLQEPERATIRKADDTVPDERRRNHKTMGATHPRDPKNLKDPQDPKNLKDPQDLKDLKHLDPQRPYVT
jgi:hypothetical protein